MIGFDNQHNEKIELVFGQKYQEHEHLEKLAFPSESFLILAHYSRFALFAQTISI